MVREAVKRSALVIATGGLGPTEDDVTKKVFARVLKRQMVLDDEILERIKARFRRRGLEMPANNARQALVPVGGRILENPAGTAPGIWMETAGCEVILLPGPPSELKPMFEECCMSRLAELAGGVRLFKQVFKATGITESSLDERIAPIYAKYKNPVTTILASPGEVQIHLIGRGKSEDEARKIVTELADKIEFELGDFIFSRGEESLEQIVGYYLMMREMTLSVAESCTGGLVSQRITSVPGSSSYFLSGVTCYSNRVKDRPRWHSTACDRDGWCRQCRSSQRLGRGHSAEDRRYTWTGNHWNCRTGWRNSRKARGAGSYCTVHGLQHRPSGVSICRRP